jgi:Rrf2 family nitric oxide-sensitive transcriptional repressor
LRLLAATDVALRLLMRLGTAPTRRQGVEVLSRSVGVPRNHVHKIVQDLAEAGIVKTYRGAGGGVELTVAPAAIRLGMVVRRFEAGQALVECFRADGGACCLAPDCRLRGVLWHAREAFLAQMDATTLADCLAPPAGPPARVLSPVTRQED